MPKATELCGSRNRRERLMQVVRCQLCSESGDRRRTLRASFSLRGKSKEPTTSSQSESGGAEGSWVSAHRGGALGVAAELEG